MADVANVGPSPQSIPVIHSEWPPDVLYVHLQGKIEDLKAHLGDLRTSDLLALQAAFVAAEKAVDTALTAAEKAVGAALAAQEKAVSAALASAEKATDKYEREVERWRANSNEWRSAMDDREKNFLSIDAYTAAHGPLAADVADLKKTRDQNQGRQMAMTVFMGVAFAIITVVLRFV